MASKQVLREIYLSKRLFLSEQEWALRNQSIIKQVISLIEDKNYRYIHTFLPIHQKREIDTYQFISHYKNKEEVQFVIPKTEKGNLMSHYVYDSQCTVEANKWGIPEPIKGDLADISKIDLVLVPLIIADKLGQRIGYGKGYYDRFLTSIPQAKKVGVSLLPLLDEILFVEGNDISLDLTIYPV